MDESLKILQKYEEWGVSAVWCTPHIMEDYPNTTAALRQRFAELQAAYDGPVKLNLAAENMMDMEILSAPNIPRATICAVMVVPMLAP